MMVTRVENLDDDNFIRIPLTKIKINEKYSNKNTAITGQFYLRKVLEVGENFLTDYSTRSF